MNVNIISQYPLLVHLDVDPCSQLEMSMEHPELNRYSAVDG